MDRDTKILNKKEGGTKCQAHVVSLDESVTGAFSILVWSKKVETKNYKQALEKLRQGNFSERIYIEPTIPEKQLKNAISKMQVADGSNVLILVDNTLNKSGKSGLCITSDSIYWNEFMNKGTIRLADINKLDMKLGFRKVLKINGKDIALEQLSDDEVQPFLDFLNEVLGFKNKLTVEAKDKSKEILCVVKTEKTKGVEDILFFTSRRLIVARIKDKGAGILGDLDPTGILDASFIAASFIGEKKKKRDLKKLTPEEILEADKSNFAIPYEEINKVEISKKLLGMAAKISISTATEKRDYYTTREESNKCVVLLRPVLGEKILDLR